ncbi:pseudaminic acid biosynthesis-associated methylase [Cuspidothrix issatschenkoi LEGE 03284]|uniref:pseudaminic acid biosynthesis-associated methylase n=1 Tax=Cuspidothrix issatschenkoi TaxID=230752 RepID=UPI001882125B|nr:pseudaminic acid biosynthesis-associated methylase [Cuspidothrix issatschenkoi]MBE9231832.1 pseudaminic acid biosynthesis-associated methylase [Cuspidothrix issatschenkoi LEGE 03284]
MTNFKTEQENFWAESFGNEYVDRNANINLVAANLALFSQIFRQTQKIDSVIEFGSNIGLNLLAISQLLPKAQLSAVEINQKAVDQMAKIGGGKVNIYTQSVLDFRVDFQRNFVLIKGVLIHINPEYLNQVYDLLYQTSNKYICICEYYNPTPVEVSYRGHQGKLFKRDFAGEIMDKFNDLELIDYGFVYHRDYQFPQDDMNWFLVKKSNLV